MQTLPKIFFFFLFFSVVNIVAQVHPKLQSGPMLGNSQMREVHIWIQTNQVADIQITYRALINILPDSVSTPVLPITYKSHMITTQAHNYFVADIVADKVEPGKIYSYQVFIDGEALNFKQPLTFQTQSLWQWRSQPQDINIALGSCAYINEVQYDRPGKSYGGQYEIFQTIASKSPDAMVWLGDNVYLRETDWYSKTGVYKRYTHSRSLPELQPLLYSTHHYAIWDDHDFGPNDSDDSFIHRDITLQAFEDFWSNPTTGIYNDHKSIISQFLWADVHFYLLDNRTFRSSNQCKKCEKKYFGKEQIDWLISALIHSKATYKVIATGGQILSTATVYETYINLNPKERKYLLKRIKQENIKNIIFITGDRHHTEFSELKLGKNHTIYDWTVSPLTSGFGPRKEKNKNRVDGSLITQRNFGIMNFTGSYNNRKLHLIIYDVKGNKIWDKPIDKE